MKIVYIVEDLGVAGGVKVIVEHAEGLAARGHDVAIVTRGGSPEWISIGVPVIHVPSFAPENLPESDVHIATWYTTVLPAARAKRARRVFHFSQGYEGIYPHVAPFRREIDEAYSEPIPKLLISRHLIDLFKDRFPGELFVLPQAIRAENYAPDCPEPEGPRIPPTIGIVGPFEAVNKGIRIGLAAIARLRRDGSEIRLHRASQVSLSEEESRIARADRYLHLASVAQMIEWYRGIDLLIHPSFEAEGFPLPPLEAMASGVPVVLTTIPSFDPIPRDAVSWTAPGDEEAMAMKSRELLEDRAFWKARRARGLEIVKLFSLDAAVTELEKVLQAN